MVNSLAPNNEPCGTPDATGRLFLSSMYDWTLLDTTTEQINF